MKTIAMILLTIFVANCGEKDKKTDQPPVSPDQELQVHIERFDEHYDGLWPENLIVYMDEINECDDQACTAGYCLKTESNGQTVREVVIDLSTWSEISEIRKEALVFHELGHCVLDRGHTEFDAISFMIPSLVFSEFYAENRVELYNELFGINPIDREVPDTADPASSVESEVFYHLDLFHQY